MKKSSGRASFNGTTRQIAMTEAGQGFYERVVAILAIRGRSGVLRVARTRQKRAETCRVAVPTSFGRLHIAPHLGRFLSENTDLAVNLDLSDDFVDIVGDGYDLAVRIAELSDSSLVARRLAPVHRILCASPEYLEKHGMHRRASKILPGNHVTLAATNQDPLETGRTAGNRDRADAGADQGPTRNEVVRECLLDGVGIALRSTWDIGPELREGKLKILLPQYRASKDVGLYAVYPSRQFLPAKVRVFIDFLAKLYGSSPYWGRGP